MNEFTKKTVNEEYSKIKVPKDKLENALIDVVEYGNEVPRNRLWSRVKMPLLAVTTACMMLFMGLLFTNASLADVLKNLPIIESVFFNKGDKGLEAVYEQEKVQVINQTKENSDVSVRITEVYYDDIRFSIGYELVLQDKELPLEDVLDFITKNKFYIDNKEVNLSYGTGFSNEDMDSIKGILEIDPKKSVMEKQFDFKLEFEGTDKINGDMTFEFPVYYVTGEDLPNSEVVLEDQDAKFVVSDVTKTPSGITMDTKFSYPVSENKERLPVEYFISPGNGLWFEPLENEHRHESNQYFQEKFGSFYEKYTLEFPPIEMDGQFQVIPAVVDKQLKPRNYEIYNGVQIETNYGSFTVTRITSEQNEASLEILVNKESSFLSFENIWLINGEEPISSLNSLKQIGENLYEFHATAQEDIKNLSIDVFPIKPLENMKIIYSIN